MTRTRIIAICFALLFSTITNAKAPAPKSIIPKIDLGLKFGGNFDNIDGKSWSNTYHTGYHGGLFLGVRESIFGLQGEVLYNKGLYTYKSTGANVGNAYLDVPVLFQVKLVDRLWLQAGPQYSLLLSSKFTSNDKDASYFKTGGFSGVAGLQILLPLHLTIGARYVFGFTNWNDASSAEVWTQRSMQLFAGFRLL
jgi:hypothetical protein